MYPDIYELTHASDGLRRSVDVHSACSEAPDGRPRSPLRRAAVNLGIVTAVAAAVGVIALVVLYAVLAGIMPVTLPDFGAYH